MNSEFPQLLSKLRCEAKLTNIQLAELAPVPRSLIPGLQSGKRCVGEYQARKLGVALGLTGKELDDFIFSGIDRCTEKVLLEAQPYPAKLLNLLARQLRRAGIGPEKIDGCLVNEDAKQCKVGIVLADGTQVQIETKLEVAA